MTLTLIGDGLLRWIGMEALNVCLNQHWSDDIARSTSSFWGRPVVVLNDGESVRVSEPWCRDESPLLIAASSQEVSTWLDRDPNDLHDVVRKLTLAALSAE